MIDYLIFVCFQEIIWKIITAHRENTRLKFTKWILPILLWFINGSRTLVENSAMFSLEISIVLLCDLPYEALVLLEMAC